MQFLDTIGNSYIRTPSKFSYITGRKPKKRVEDQKPIRTFRATGIKVILFLLSQSGMIVAPYRDIANSCDVALASVAWIMNDLIELEYVFDSQTSGRKIINQQKFIDDWMSAFHRPFQVNAPVGRYGRQHILMLPFDLPYSGKTTN